MSQRPQMTPMTSTEPRAFIASLGYSERSVAIARTLVS